MNFQMDVVESLLYFENSKSLSKSIISLFRNNTRVFHVDLTKVWGKWYLQQNIETFRNIVIS